MEDIMAGQEIVYKIPYIDKGKVIEIPVKIFFVSHRVRKIYNDILVDMGKVQELYNTYKMNIDEIGRLLDEKPQGYRDEIPKLKEQNKELAESIYNYADEESIIQRRTELLIKLLQDNGITDKRLLDPESWLSNIEPDIQVELLAEAVWKDLKKKAV